MKMISSQLGFTFSYDANKENETGYENSKLVEKNTTFFTRPIKKQKVFPRKPIFSLQKLSETHYMIDLGKEVVGLPEIDFYSNKKQKIEISYGESLDNGSVRKKIGGRNFSFEYVAKEGHNIYTNYMLRIACRYLEVYSEEPIDVNYIGVLPQIYETDIESFHLENTLDQNIYEICVNTLNLCMMEHYVDTPWREQCLYAFDSRNQMLCGYYAFSDKNKDYARSNLKLISQDRRKDNLLSICYPCGTELAIPSFSLYYIIAMEEYISYTNDISLAEEFIDKIQSILNEFINNMNDGLICKFNQSCMWNFYDWSDYLDGNGVNRIYDGKPDLIINCLYVIVYQAYQKI